MKCGHKIKASNGHKWGLDGSKAGNISHKFYKTLSVGICRLIRNFEVMVRNFENSYLEILSDGVHNWSPKGITIGLLKESQLVS